MEAKWESLKRTLNELMKSRTQKKLDNLISEEGLVYIDDIQADKLFTLAVRTKNHKLYEYVLDNYCKLNVDLPDLTSLVIALSKHDLKNAEILYWKHIEDIVKQLNNNYNSKKSIFQKKKANWSMRAIIPLIISKLRDEQGLSFEEIGIAIGELIEQNCTDAMIATRNTELIEAYLYSHRPALYRSTYNRYFGFFFKFTDLPCIDVFLNYVSDVHSLKRQVFHLLMENICKLHLTQNGRVFIRGLINVEGLLKEQTVKYLEMELMKADKESLEVFFQYEFRAVIKEKCHGIDVLASVFGNPNVNVESLLKSHDINIRKAHGTDEQTVLYFAASILSLTNIQIALDKGAYLNVFYDRGSTALTLAAIGGLSYREKDVTLMRSECVRLLLMYGADPFLIPESDLYERLYEYRLRYDTDEFNRPIILIGQHFAAQLAINEEIGRSRIDNIMNPKRFWHYYNFKENFKKCRRQIEQLKNDVIHDNRGQSFTMFSLLTQREERIIQCIDESHRDKIQSYMIKYEKELLPSVDFYYISLKRRIDIIDKILAVIAEMKIVLFHCAGVYDDNHPVLRKISHHIINDFLIIK